MQVFADSDGIQPHAKHLGVFGFLERELRQIHLVGQPSLGPHRGHERLDVLGHRLLAGNELGAQSGGVVTFVVRQLLPVRPVAREVDVGRIPELCVAPGEQLQWQARPVESARGEQPERVRVM